MDEIDWTKNFGRKQVGRTLGARCYWYHDCRLSAERFTVYMKSQLFIIHEGLIWLFLQNSNQNFDYSKCPAHSILVLQRRQCYQWVHITVQMNSAEYKFTLEKICGFLYPKMTYAGFINIWQFKSSFEQFLPVFRP